MRAFIRSLLGIALVVIVGVVLVVWLGPSLAEGGGAAPAATQPVTAPGTSAPSPSTPPPAVPSGAEPATVRYVHDGDTLYLTPDGSGAELKVRLLGIDTPEIGDRGECYGDVARDRTRALLPQGTRVLVLADTEPLDQYGRSLLHVFLPDGTHLNLLLIEEGLAYATFYRPNYAYEDEFRAAQKAAERGAVGMWGAC